MKVLVTGAAGFVGTYIVKELLARGIQVIGVDNFSKYGERSIPHYPNYLFCRMDVKDSDALSGIAESVDHIIAGAARIGGISYFHEYAYDLIAENDRIIASTFDAAIHAKTHGCLQKITVISSSMVFENATKFPTPEKHLHECPPPSSTYGFQKLAVEYYAKGAYEQYRLPYTIVRPFNCIGVGETRAKNAPVIKSGDVSLAMSHVVPDLIVKTLKRQTPLHVLGSGDQVRCYTYGPDVASGIVHAMLDSRLNEDYNISTVEETKVVDLAEMIWRKINGGTADFRIECDLPYKYDVQKRIPDADKAWLNLNFRATTPLSEALDEIIPWYKYQVLNGAL